MCFAKLSYRFQPLLAQMGMIYLGTFYDSMIFLVWRGQKPDSAKIRQFGTMVELTRPGNVILLCNNDEGVATCGVVTPCR